MQFLKTKDLIKNIHLGTWLYHRNRNDEEGKGRSS
jgi:hypothetical protein